MLGYFVIIFILLSYNLYTYNANIYLMLGGFWEASPDFCQEAGLEIFCIYIDNDVRGDRACYLLAKNINGDLVLNEPTLAHIDMTWSANWGMNPAKPNYFTIKFANLESSFFPATAFVLFYPLYQKIVIYDEETIYAVLYKNGANSEIREMVEPDLDISDVDSD